MIAASGLDEHGLNSSGKQLPYTHLDIAGSAGDIDVLPTAVPLLMFATSNQYYRELSRALKGNSEMQLMICSKAAEFTRQTVQAVPADSTVRHEDVRGQKLQTKNTSSSTPHLATHSNH
ncbi:hypothetical protein TSMEX_008464 [Taenia solium]|eukprot:TsM_001213900 transcript=TsM_001213900 gene=TsM_001213900